MSERDIGQEILEGIREIKAYKAGRTDLRTRELKEPSSPQDIRRKLSLSQSAFAGLKGSCPVRSRRRARLRLSGGSNDDGEASSNRIRTRRSWISR